MGVDELELRNLQAEEALSKTIRESFVSLHKAASSLESEFSSLLSLSNKLQKVIYDKESANVEEISVLSKLKSRLSSLSDSSVQKKAKYLKSKEEEESKLSRKEAELLGEILEALRSTYVHCKSIMVSDEKLYVLLKQIYEKDLQDFNLEVADLRKV